MTRWIDQDMFYDPEITGNGNCVQAAIASLLGLRLDEVPHFNLVYGPSPCDIEDGIDKFLAERGYALVRLPYNHVPEVCYLAYGRSSRGCFHVVIMNAGKLIHDPHFSREGVLKVDEIKVLVPLDAAQLCLKPGIARLPDNPTVSDYIGYLDRTGVAQASHQSPGGPQIKFGWLPKSGTYVCFDVPFSSFPNKFESFGGELFFGNECGLQSTSTSTDAIWVVTQ